MRPPPKHYPPHPSSTSTSPYTTPAAVPQTMTGPVTRNIFAAMPVKYPLLETSGTQGFHLIEEGKPKDALNKPRLSGEKRKKDKARLRQPREDGIAALSSVDGR